MRYLAILLISTGLFSQTVAPATVDYGHYAIMLASANKTEVGVMPMITPDQKFQFVPIPSIADSIKAGYSPVFYADLLRLIQQIVDEINACNQRMSASGSWPRKLHRQAPR